MSTSELIGKEHRLHLEWLSTTWMENASPVCFLEGFPGTGKTTIARELLAWALSVNLTAIMITAPEGEKDPTDDLLLEIAVELNTAGRNELAKAIDDGRRLADVLSEIVSDPILIIIDEFQRTMQGERAITRGGFAKVLSTLANRKGLRGRILLLTNRLVERASWSEPYAIRTLNGMVPEDAVELLEYFAKNGNRLDDIDPARRYEVVKWLGGNPRAIRLLVSSLAYESLDELIGLQPELWEMRDRDVSAELVADLERQLLKKTLGQLCNEYTRGLYRLSVLRKPFKRQAIEILFEDKKVYSEFRNEMIDRFLLEQHNGWFNLHPIVREIGLQKLGLSFADFQQAHKIISQYYTRHFGSQKIVGWGNLGGYFVEARYHLVKGEQLEDLKSIAQRFQNYITSTLNANSSIPDNQEELDESIAMLSALLETPGSRELEYYLARLFQARNQRNDLRRAIHHAYEALSDFHSAPWILCAQLLMQDKRPYEAIEVLEKGIRKISVDDNAASLYALCGDYLFQVGKYDEAMILLKDGIEHIPSDKSLFSLYVKYAEFLTQTNQLEKAIVLLKQGIKRIPPDKGLVTLYYRCGDLLAQVGRNDEAVDLIRQGIDNINIESATPLYIFCGELMAKIGNTKAAIEFQKKGMGLIPFNNNLADLYVSCSHLLVSLGEISEAISLLKKGMRIIPADKNSVSLYSYCSDLLVQVDQYDEAIILLKAGIDRIFHNKSVGSLYYYCSRLLVFRGRLTEAMEILSRGIARMQWHHGREGLVEFALLLYASKQDSRGITQLVQNNPGISYQHILLSKVLLCQIQGEWEDAVRYSKQARMRSLVFPTLIYEEAFSALCAGKFEYAAEVLSGLSQPDDEIISWLQALIYLKIGNFEGDGISLGHIDETFLIELWKKPSMSWSQIDLAYYFPTLPPVLTGFPYFLRRVVYHPLTKGESNSTEMSPLPQIEERIIAFPTLASKDLAEDCMIHILHLSDLHIESEEQANNYRIQLETDLIKELTIPRLEYLVISGDIVNRSTPDEYKVAFEFVDSLIKRFELDSSRVIIVPGNHDLNWDLSENAYIFVPKRKLSTSLTEGHYISAGEAGMLLRDDDLYRKRFTYFNEHFYRHIYPDQNFSLDYADQTLWVERPDDHLLFVGLNSCWEIDHHYCNRASISMSALDKVLDRLQKATYDDWLKIVVWHHPIAGKDMMNDGFMGLLAVHGFQICLHGHIHEAIEGFHKYDDHRNIRIIGAGTFGAPAKEQVTGIPLQYNLLSFNSQTSVMTVQTRKKEKPNGAWSADARWGDKNNPKPVYSFHVPHYQPNRQGSK